MGWEPKVRSCSETLGWDHRMGTWDWNHTVGRQRVTMGEIDCEWFGGL